VQQKNVTIYTTRIAGHASAISVVFHIELIRLEQKFKSRTYAREEDSHRSRVPFPLILLTLLQLVVLPWFCSSSPTFCSSSIQLDSYTQPSATTSMLYRYKRSSRVSPGIEGGQGRGRGNSEWVRFTSYAGTDVHTVAHTKLTNDDAQTVSTRAFSIVWWLNSLISQIPAWTMQRGVRRRV